MVSIIGVRDLMVSKSKVLGLFQSIAFIGPGEAISKLVKNK